MPRKKGDIPLTLPEIEKMKSLALLPCCCRSPRSTRLPRLASAWESQSGCHLQPFRRHKL